MFARSETLMNDVFFGLGDDVANVLCVQLLDGKRDGVHNVLSEIVLDQVFFEPVVADELALAVADLNTGESICLTAIELLDVVLVVVANVLAKS